MSVSIITGQALKANVLHRFLAPCLVNHCQHQLQSVRCMSRKKQPSQSGQKEVWLSKAALQRAKASVRQMPRNWEKFMERKPEDDIWIKTYYPPVKYSAAEALDMHRELACPEMLNNKDGLVMLYTELNMCTSKKTRFMAPFSGVLLLPHYFDDGTENKVLAFCRTKDERATSINEGALYAGGSDILSQIESGEIRSYMFDHAVCTVDFIDDISKARKHIRDKFPNKKAGAVGTDIGVLVHYFRFGKNYSCEKEGDDFARMQINIGPLSLTNEQLLENLKAYIERINFHRAKNVGKVPGNFITKAYLKCPPSGEKIYLKDEELVSEKGSGNPVDQITTLTFAAEKKDKAAAAN